MIFTENETVELKAVFTEDIKKEIIAFANTRGGKIYVGVEDNGSVTGISSPDETIQKITNSARDSIKPDVTMFLHFNVIKAGKKTIVETEVQPGTHKPYYIAKKGLRPEGVYVRQGTSSVPASDISIRQMIKDTDGDKYEDMRSLNQQLTFDKLKSEFKKRNLDINNSQMKTLGLFDSEGLYTNLALLFSDQCPHIIKAATFSGSDVENFHDRCEFTGSILQQLEDAYKYLDMRNNTSATFSGLYREDHVDYPDTALREALINAVIHRDYSISASTLISVFNNRIEILSVGGLAGGISYDDIMLGVSFCRNEKLANVFYRMKMIEAYGTGIDKIFRSYTGNPAQPVIQVTSGAFKISLPNMQTPPEKEPTTVKGSNGLQNNLEKVKDMFRQKNKLTRSEIQSALGVSVSTARRLLDQLIAAGLIEKIGTTKSSYYIPVRK